MLVEKEKECLGFYLSSHPIELLRKRMNAQLAPLITLKAQRGYVRFLCMIERVKQPRTKNGALMAFAVSADETSKIDLVCMPNIYEIYHEKLVRGKYFYIEGVIDKENSCLVKKMTPIEDEEA